MDHAVGLYDIRDYHAPIPSECFRIVFHLSLVYPLTYGTHHDIVAHDGDIVDC